jgi:hypothetical protein
MSLENSIAQLAESIKMLAGAIQETKKVTSSNENVASQATNLPEENSEGTLDRDAVKRKLEQRGVPFNNRCSTVNLIKLLEKHSQEETPEETSTEEKTDAPSGQMPLGEQTHAPDTTGDTAGQEDNGSFDKAAETIIVRDALINMMGVPGYGKDAAVALAKKFGGTKVVTQMEDAGLMAVKAELKRLGIV